MWFSFWEYIHLYQAVHNLVSITPGNVLQLWLEYINRNFFPFACLSWCLLQTLPVVVLCHFFFINIIPLCLCLCLQIVHCMNEQFEWLQSVCELACLKIETSFAVTSLGKKRHFQVFYSTYAVINNINHKQNICPHF